MLELSKEFLAPTDREGLAPRAPLRNGKRSGGPRELLEALPKSGGVDDDSVRTAIRRSSRQRAWRRLGRRRHAQELDRLVAEEWRRGDRGIEAGSGLRRSSPRRVRAIEVPLPAALGSQRRRTSAVCARGSEPPGRASRRRALDPTDRRCRHGLLADARPKSGRVPVRADAVGVGMRARTGRRGLLLG